MLELTLKHFSKSFGVNMPVQCIIKNHDSDAPSRILYLLHGYEGDCNSWIRGSRVYHYIKILNIEFPLFVIMPSITNTFYIDVHPFLKGGSYITEELPLLLKKLFPQCSQAPEFTNIAGLSMGGFGALRTALVRPQQFKSVASFSGAMDITKRYLCYKYEIETSAHGTLKGAHESLARSDMDIFELSSRWTHLDKSFTKFYLYCGTEDYLLEENREFSSHLQSLDFNFEYSEQEGYEHNWDHWDMCIRNWLVKAYEN